MRSGIFAAFLAVEMSLVLFSDAVARSALNDSTDLKIRNSSQEDAIGSENSIFIDPNDARILLEAHNNRLNAPGISAWVSQDGGKTWIGNNNPLGSPVGNGDPAAVIRKPTGAGATRYLAGQIAGNVGQEVLYKDVVTSLIWTRQQIVDESLGLTDKNHLWVDNNETGSAAGNIYAAWSNVDTRRIEIIRSTSNGVLWSDRQNLDVSGTRGEFGVNLKVGISDAYRHHVYAVWGETTGIPSDRVSSISFSKSTDEGVFWSSPAQVAVLGSRGYRLRESLPEKSMGTNSGPTMTVDRAGSIYVVWGQKRVDGSSDDGEIYLVKSSDEGGTWSALGSQPVHVNQEPGIADQWLPWITWDNCTDALVVIFFDGRADNARAETYIAVSYDGGAHFLQEHEKRISDASWGADVTSAGRAGDYIGIAAQDGIAYPVWSDDHEEDDGSTFKIYLSPILLWGVEQPTVNVDVLKNNAGGTVTVAAAWETNLTAGAENGDALKIQLPNQQEFTTPGASADGIHHRIQASTAVPCQPGMKYVVSSKRLECQLKRESDWIVLGQPFHAETQRGTTADKSEGVAWGDYDGDGNLDLYVTSNGGPNRLWRNQGLGYLVDVTSAPLGGSGNAAAWGDYDNDGLLDLCVVNGKLPNGAGNAQPNKLYRNTGGGQFMDVTTGSLALAEDSRAVTWVDYDNDGKLDLYVVNYDVPSRLLHGNGNGTFTDVSSSVNMNNGTAAAWGDYDRDGDLDLYLVRKGTEDPDPEGRNQLFRNDGNGEFTVAGYEYRSVFDDGLGQAAAWGDYNNDRYPDLILVNQNGDYTLFRNQSGTGFGNGIAITGIGTGGEGVAWGDYDNDGWLDLFFTNDGANALYHNNNGDGSFTASDDGAFSDEGIGRGVAWGDRDADGDLDLCLARETGGNRWAWYTTCSSNHWLHVNLVGAASPVRTVSVSNRSAIGARVRAVVGSLSRIQEVSGGSGRGSQNSLTAEFGLGPTATVVDTLEVRWPGGETRKEVNVDADQMLTLQEWIYGIQETSTQFCQNNAAKWRLVVSWQTVVPTAGNDVLEIYEGNACETGGPPAITRTATPTQGGLQHSVTYEAGCSTGTRKYVIRSSNGTSVAAEFCRTVVVSSCPTCWTHCDPPCELE